MVEARPPAAPPGGSAEEPVRRSERTRPEPTPARTERARAKADPLPARKAAEPPAKAEPPPARVAAATLPPPSASPEDALRRARAAAAGSEAGGGGSDDEDVQKVFRRHAGGIKVCFERARKDDPNLGGRISVRVSVGSDGVVRSVSLPPAHALTKFGLCVTGQVRRWSFPASGKSYSASMPIVLSGS
jgi:outer membrane biosynthesis protein TonB